MAEIAVIGAGPAGCVFAARMAALGHDVTILEQSAFPRPRLGESLTPGVAPLLAAAGLSQALDGPQARPAGAVRVAWDGPEREREPGAGLIVDRAGFDAALLDGARAAGARVAQPARVRAWTREHGRWRIEIDGQAPSSADFLADARGRGGRAPRRGARTLALYAYGRARRPGAGPRIAALADGWAWGVPLPGGLYNMLMFLDAGASLSRFAAFAEDADGFGPVRGCDATPYLEADPVGAGFIRIGDRALALDPLSSSGVQKAIQGALSGAVVANTLLRRPERAAPAMQFHRAQLRSAAERHAAWAGGHYATAGHEGPFWAARAAAPPAPEPEPRPVDPAFLSSAPIKLSPQAAWRDTPCLGREYVALAPALTHPNLADPVAFLGGEALAPLLRATGAARTALEMARGWPMPLERGLSIAAWLAARGVLERACA
jgi:flavin-dependent dehydrogenase